jgi:predicted dehydrogenase
MQKHDPILLRESISEDQEMNHSWQRGGCWYYFYTHYCDPKRFTAERVSGFELTKLWDRNRDVAEIAAGIFYNKPRVCDTLDEVSEGVDLVFIADCNGDGQDHLKLASPGLKKGVPTFIDKPFAYKISDARKLLKLAADAKAPLMSMSMMRAAPAVARFRSRLAETGGVNFGSVYGGSTNLAGLFHAITLTQAVFGPGIQSVQAMAGKNQTLVHLGYGDRKNRPAHGVTISCDVGITFHCGLYISAIGHRRKVDSHDIGDWENPFSAAEVLKRVRKMVRTGKSTEPVGEMVECVAVAQAYRESLKKGTAIQIPTLLRRSGAEEFILK